MLSALDLRLPRVMNWWGRRACGASQANAGKGRWDGTGAAGSKSYVELFIISAWRWIEYRMEAFGIR